MKDTVSALVWYLLRKKLKNYTALDEGHKNYFVHRMFVKKEKCKYDTEVITQLILQ